MTTTSESACYYNSNLKAKTFDILKRNDDGTVDIGTGTTLVVRRCQVTTEPRHGCVTLGAVPAPRKPAQVPEAEIITEAEIQSELATNPRALNDYFMAKTLIAHRRTESAAESVQPRMVEFRSLHRAPAATA